jgi:hypothetical protein
MHVSVQMDLAKSQQIVIVRSLSVGDYGLLIEEKFEWFLVSNS